MKFYLIMPITYSLFILDFILTIHLIPHFYIIPLFYSANLIPNLIHSLSHLVLFVLPSFFISQNLLFSLSLNINIYYILILFLSNSISMMVNVLRPIIYIPSKVMNFFQIFLKNNSKIIIHYYLYSDSFQSFLLILKLNLTISIFNLPQIFCLSYYSHLLLALFHKISI